MPGLVGLAVVVLVLGLVGVRWGVRVGVARSCDCSHPRGSDLPAEEKKDLAGKRCRIGSIRTVPLGHPSLTS